MTDTSLRMLLLAAMLMVMAAGSYATCYALGRLLMKKSFHVTAYIFAGLTVASVVAMICAEGLPILWKVLLFLSGIVYVVLPRGMWWLVRTVHDRERRPAAGHSLERPGCAHQTSTVSSCAFCEHEGESGRPSR